MKETKHTQTDARTPMADFSVEQYTEGWNAATKQAAYQAKNACLVPPDGGSPTEAESDLCDEAARRIIAGIVGNQTDTQTDTREAALAALQEIYRRMDRFETFDVVINQICEDAFTLIGEKKWP